ncbi:hypothetical protein MLD38_015847 [Melastoma candidum]|uniref:Uncharacterized protein n=1 Tax=Melastoma candidum TaxID=119954 RepID=A0ACB9RJD8_9MYRT|nr:hypothetical protein MLD38_015847 [Melastoma candidum]
MFSCDMDRLLRVLRCLLIVLWLGHRGIVLSQADGSSVSSPRETSPSKLSYKELLEGNYRKILVNDKLNFQYACGFYCSDNRNAYLFAIFIIPTNTDTGTKMSPAVVWSANRNRLVGTSASLNLSADGGLVLQDSDGSVVWSRGKTGNPIRRMNLTDEGNLLLIGESNQIIWQSFDEPTDSLLPGQKLALGKKLIPNFSERNWTENGAFSLAVTRNGLCAQVETSPPQVYFKYAFPKFNESISVEYVSGRLSSGNFTLKLFPASSSSPQYLKLESDGQLRAYNWDSAWKGTNLMKSPLGDCFFPFVCREYDICSNGQCSCLPTPQSGEGCLEVNAVSHPCDDPSSTNEPEELVEVYDVTHFSLEGNITFIPRNDCMEECKNSCSCKVAFFHEEIGRDGIINSSCHLLPQVFSLINMSSIKANLGYKSTAYIKVQSKKLASPGTTTNSSDTGRSNKSSRRSKVRGLSIGALVFLIMLTSLLICITRKRDANEIEENYINQVPGLPTRFTYGYLKAVTDNFSGKLGEGGFGSVYEGTLNDRTRVAVKKLNRFDHVTRSFLAEMESMGSIHHLNLVRLVGFCAERSHRLLVYEYMSNGSLDRWIFPKSEANVLDWRRRQKIILDIARGLNYLHRDCRQKIIHMDIKPQNILLDENFNAKVADFGLSKLIDRDKSHVVTTMRGTPGYLAHEWLSGTITEKVDVYSFGVVTLEIVCGRRVFDQSKDPEEMHLLSLLKKKVQDGCLIDLIDKSCVDILAYEREAVDMLKVAGWCLEGDFSRRPSMSMVINVLEGTMDIPGDLSYNFFYPSLRGEGGGDNEHEYERRMGDRKLKGTSMPLPETLSTPR